MSVPVWGGLLCACHVRGPGVFDRVRRAALQGRGYNRLKWILLVFYPTCLLYGASSVAVRVEVSTFRPRGYVRTGVRTGVGINRRTGVSAPGTLYSVEYVEPEFEVRRLNNAYEYA